MTPEPPILDLRQIEDETAQWAPIVRQAFEQAGGPSAQTLHAIRRQAATQHRRSRAVSLWLRPLAAAAALAMLAGGSMQMRLAAQRQQAAMRGAALTQLIRLGALTPDLSPTTARSAEEIALRLLELQGLDNNANFLTSEEAESLWL